MQKKRDKTPKATDKCLMDNIHNNLKKEDFISYKELANTIGLKYYSGGKSKQLQLENLKRFIEYEYDAEQKKYLITNIYEECLPKQPRKLREDAIYTKYIEMLLLAYLKEQTGCSAIMSKASWWAILSMVNSDFVKYQNPSKRNLLLEEHLTKEMDRENIDEFMENTNRRFTTLFSRALKSLESRRLIDTPKYIYIYRYKDDEFGEFKIADDQLVSDIIDCEYDALHELGLKTKEQLVLYPKKRQKYYDILNEIEYERLGFAECYRELQIVFGKTHLNTEFNYTKQQLIDAGVECNNVFKLNIDNSIINKYRKNRVTLQDYQDMPVEEVNEFLNIIGIDTNSLFISEDKELKNYVENQLALSNRLIKKY